jgi:hypothetical protein
LTARGGSPRNINRQVFFVFHFFTKRSDCRAGPVDVFGSTYCYYFKIINLHVYCCNLSLGLRPGAGNLNPAQGKSGKTAKSFGQNF